MEFHGQKNGADTVVHGCASIAKDISKSQRYDRWMGSARVVAGRVRVPYI